MELIRFGEISKEKIGVILENKRLDTSSFGENYNENFFESNGIDRLKKFVGLNKYMLPVIDNSVRLGCPSERPSKII